MSQYVKVLQHNGGFISLLADDDGVIQYTTNDADFDGILAGNATVNVDATLDGDGSVGDPLTVLSAPIATAPANAATFSATLAAGNDSITTLVADAQNLDITGLVGATDGDYEFWYDLIALKKTGGVNNVLSLQPENLDTNQTGEIMGSAGGTAFGADTTIMSLGTNTDTGDHHVMGHGYLTSKAGRNRFFQCTSQYITAVQIQFQTAVIWTGTATAITKLRWNSTLVDGLLTGSYVRLRRLRNVT